MKTVVVTGGSSGIGEAVVNLFANKGYKVISMSRKSHNSEAKQYGKGSIETRACNVVNPESVKEAFRGIKTIDCLITCAGYGIGGSAEFTKLEDAKSQFETNYFGTVNVINEVLPRMRENKGGKIIITGSVEGRFPIAFQSHYSATKYALEGYAGALKHEVRPFNIKVSVIEPGDTKTGFTKERVITEPEESPYYKKAIRSIKKMEKDEQNGASALSVAKLYYKVAKKRNPGWRYTAGFSYKLLIFLKRFVSDKFIMFVTGKMYS